MAKTTKKDAEKKDKVATIEPPNIQVLQLPIRGITPYSQNAFSQKAAAQMRAIQEAGSTSKKGAKREPRDFEADYEAAKHISKEGWIGIPAPAFRNALISACRVCGFAMTRAKLAIFVDPDGYDRVSHQPLVRITEGEPVMDIAPARNSNQSVDLRARPLWGPGWKANLNLSFDGDMFSEQDVMNLVHRAGLQVGVGEGRPDSKQSCGIGYGTFEIDLPNYGDKAA